MQTTDNTTNDTTNTGDDNVIEGAVTEVKAPSNDLVILDPERFATELFQPFHDQLAVAKRRRFNYDITTSEGMTKAKEAATLFQKIRTSADKAKTAAKKPIDQAGKAILARFNVIEEAAKAEEKKHNDAITAEKQRLEDIEEEKRQKERARIEAIETRLAYIRGIPAQLAKADSAAISARLSELMAKQLDPAMYDEFLEQAVSAMNETTDALRALEKEALEREAEKAELERLRQEREAAEARAKAEQEAREKAAAAEREAAAAREAELQRQLEAMKAQMAAMQPKVETPADNQPINPQGQYYSTTTFKDNGDHILCNSDGTRSVFCDVDEGDGANEANPISVVPEAPLFAAVAPKPVRPSDVAMVSILAAHYEVDPALALEWLADFNVSAVRAQLAL